MNKVKLGIIGMGNMGFAHFKDMIAESACEIVVTAIADRIDAKLNKSIDHIKAYNAEHPDKALPIPATFSEGSDHPPRYHITEKRLRP